MTTVMLATLLAGSLAQAAAPSATPQPRLFRGWGGKPIVPVFATTNDVTPFTPKPTVRLAARPAPALHGRDDEEREIICGTVVVRKPSTMDSKMLLPPRETGAAVRRIEPDACRGSQAAAPPK